MSDYFGGTLYENLYGGDRKHRRGFAPTNHHSYTDNRNRVLNKAATRIQTRARGNQSRAQGAALHQMRNEELDEEGATIPSAPGQPFHRLTPRYDDLEDLDDLETLSPLPESPAPLAPTQPRGQPRYDDLEDLDDLETLSPLPESPAPLAPRQPRGEASRLAIIASHLHTADPPESPPEPPSLPEPPAVEPMDSDDDDDEEGEEDDDEEEEEEAEEEEEESTIDDAISKINELGSEVERIGVLIRQTLSNEQAEIWVTNLTRQLTHLSESITTNQNTNVSNFDTLRTGLSQVQNTLNDNNDALNDRINNMENNIGTNTNLLNDKIDHVDDNIEEIDTKIIDIGNNIGTNTVLLNELNYKINEIDTKLPQIERQNQNLLDTINELDTTTRNQFIAARNDMAGRLMDHTQQINTATAREINELKEENARQLAAQTQDINTETTRKIEELKAQEATLRREQTLQINTHQARNTRELAAQIDELKTENAEQIAAHTRDINTSTAREINERLQAQSTEINRILAENAEQLRNQIATIDDNLALETLALSTQMTDLNTTVTDNSNQIMAQITTLEANIMTHFVISLTTLTEIQTAVENITQNQLHLGTAMDTIIPLLQNLETQVNTIDQTVNAPPPPPPPVANAPPPPPPVGNAPPPAINPAANPVVPDAKLTAWIDRLNLTVDTQTLQTSLIGEGINRIEDFKYVNIDTMKNFFDNNLNEVDKNKLIEAIKQIKKTPKNKRQEKGIKIPDEGHELKKQREDRLRLQHDHNKQMDINKLQRSQDRGRHDRYDRYDRHDRGRHDRHGRHDYRHGRYDDDIRDRHHDRHDRHDKNHDRRDRRDRHNRPTGLGELDRHGRPKELGEHDKELGEHDKELGEHDKGLGEVDKPDMLHKPKELGELNMLDAPTQKHKKPYELKRMDDDKKISIKKKDKYLMSDLMYTLKDINHTEQNKFLNAVGNQFLYDNDELNQFNINDTTLQTLQFFMNILITEYKNDRHKIIQILDLLANKNKQNLNKTKKKKRCPNGSTKREINCMKNKTKKKRCPNGSNRKIKNCIKIESDKDDKNNKNDKSIFNLF